MCGLAGVYGGGNGPDLENVVAAMAGTLRHRGPDDGRQWVDRASGIALGHTRLSIVDLSEAGAQPMASACGRYLLAFNGEIYNHRDLRSELESGLHAPAWRGHSDTETLLAGIAAWGLEAALQRAAGMFALALWDCQARRLHLARDRFGEKPLYYGWAGGMFLFGSELKALRAAPGFDAPVCREALAQYLRFAYVPAPRSIYRDIFKLEPGCILTIDAPPPGRPPRQPLRPGQRHGTVSITRFWSLSAVVQTGAKDPVRNEAEGLGLLESVLHRAVGRQMLSDVPLGAFLSGGVDSSLVVALMQQQSPGRVRTFTVGFDEAGFDEAPHALAVARHIGTEHTEIRMGDADARAVIPLLPTLYDEPFADSSQIPTYLVCKAARTGVTVALSGDAGDEMFGGYNRYLWGPALWNRFGSLPFAMRRALGSGVLTVPEVAWDALGSLHNRLRSDVAGVAGTGDKAHRIGSVLSRARTVDDLYLGLVSRWPEPARMFLGADGSVTEPGSLLEDALPVHGMDSDVLRMMYRDAMTYLPDDVLCKVDRAAMGVGLETRAPFLDPDVAALAWRLPLAMKIREGQGKWALRQILYRHVPKELIERPKAGFAMPVGQWLRGPLRDWAEDLLDPVRMRSEGYLDPAPVQRKWRGHLAGGRSHTEKLWTVLMFQAWLREWSGRRAGVPDGY